MLGTVDGQRVFPSERLTRPVSKVGFELLAGTGDERDAGVVSFELRQPGDEC